MQQFKLLDYSSDNILCASLLIELSSGTMTFLVERSLYVPSALALQALLWDIPYTKYYLMVVLIVQLFRLFLRILGGGLVQTL